jgi:hypothetical protein
MLRGCRGGRIRAADLRPFHEPPRLLICPQQGVAILGTLFQAASLELQRCAIKLVEELGMPLSQPFVGQELGRQSLNLAMIRLSSESMTALSFRRRLGFRRPPPRGIRAVIVFPMPP